MLPQDAPGLDLMREFFSYLYQLDCLRRPRWRTEGSPYAAAQIYYQSKNLLHMILGEQYSEVASGLSSDLNLPLMHALAITCEIYLKTVLNHTRVNGAGTNLLIYRILGVWKEMGPNPFLQWDQDTGKFLLWMLFVQADACSLEGPERQCLVGDLRSIVQYLGIQSREEFERILRIFPWTNEFLNYTIAWCWRMATS
jgi:hypothetical protein